MNNTTTNVGLENTAANTSPRTRKPTGKLLAFCSCLLLLVTGCPSDGGGGGSSSSGTKAPTSLIGKTFAVTVTTVGSSNGNHLQTGNTVTYQLQSATVFHINGGIVNDPNGGLTYTYSGKTAHLVLHYTVGRETFDFAFTSATAGTVSWRSELNSGTYANYKGTFRTY